MDVMLLTLKQGIPDVRIYKWWAILNDNTPTIYPSVSRERSFNYYERQEFWKLQGNILGSCEGC